MKAKKIGKIILRVLLVIFILFVVFIIGVFVFHQIKRNEEMDMLKIKGYYNPVSVGDHNINVAKFGNPNGKHTIVAMAGLGSGDYPVSVRKATAEIEKDNLLVFPDREGYGLSDGTDAEMTIEHIIEEYRTALKNAGIALPYVLLPHSISGPYATYWVSKYPEEIEGVAMLDGTVLDEMTFQDEPYHEVDFNDKFMAFLCKMGFSRLVLRQSNYLYPAYYSEEEQKLGDALMLMTQENVNCASEYGCIAHNCKVAYEGIVTNDVPKVYICAGSGYESREDIEANNNWVNEQIKRNNLNMPLRETTDEIVQKILDACEESRNTSIYPYAEKMGNCEVVLLGGDHQIYQQRPEECAKILKDFVDGLDK